MSPSRRDDFLQRYHVDNNYPNGSRYTRTGGTSLDNYRNSNRTAYTQKTANNLKRKGIALSLAAVLAVGGIAATVNHFQNQNPHVTPIEQVVQGDEDLKELGISQEDFNELESIKSALNSSNIDEDTLDDLQDRLETLSLSIAKSKLADSLGDDVSPDRIVLLYNPESSSGPAWQAVDVKDENSLSAQHSDTTISYSDFSYSNLSGARHSIDKNIANYITNVAKLQSINNPSIEDLRRATTNLEQFTYYDIELAGGNLQTSPTQIQELSNDVSRDEER